jgi:hypothetical protein
MERLPVLGFILVLSALIVISGCTTPGVRTGNGVVIEEFTPSFTSVYPGELVEFQLKFRNVGGVKATSVFAEVLGLDEDWAASSKGFENNRFNPSGTELFPREEACGYDKREVELDPPDMTYGTEGESQTCTWRYIAPQIPEGFNPSYEATARVFYNYQTDLIKSITVLSTQEMMKLNQQGRTVPASTVSSTNSPISITVDARDPVRIWQDGVKFPIAITFTNIGGGMACLKDQCKKPEGGAWNKVDFKFIEAIDKAGGTESDQLKIDCFGHEQSVDVWTNKPNTIICDVTVGDTSRIVGYEERLIGISAKYSYFTDAQATITIL